MATSRPYQDAVLEMDGKKLWYQFNDGVCLATFREPGAGRPIPSLINSEFSVGILTVHGDYVVITHGTGSDAFTINVPLQRFVYFR